MTHFPLIAIATSISLIASVAYGQTDPTGDILLTISDAEGNMVAEYDLAALEALEAETFETSTIWTSGVQSFTGVPLGILLETVNVTEGEISAQAINDYATTIPVTDAVDGGPIVAYLNDGEPMSVRDKGPLWIVYPYDTDTAYQTETIYSRSIWQLDRLQILN